MVCKINSQTRIPFQSTLAIIFFTWQSIASIIGVLLYSLLFVIFKERKWLIPICCITLLFADILCTKYFSDYKPFQGVQPIASIGNRNVSLNMTYIPPVHEGLAELLFFQLKISAASWQLSIGLIAASVFPRHLWRVFLCPPKGRSLASLPPRHSYIHIHHTKKNNNLYVGCNERE